MRMRGRSMRFLEFLNELTNALRERKSTILRTVFLSSMMGSLVIFALIIIKNISSLNPTFQSFLDLVFTNQNLSIMFVAFIVVPIVSLVSWTISRRIYEPSGSSEAQIERYRSSDVEFLKREYREQINSQIREYLADYSDRELRPQLESMLESRLDSELSSGLIKKIDQRLKDRISSVANKDSLIKFASDMLSTAKSKILEKAEKSERASITFRRTGIGLMVLGLFVAVSRVFGWITPLASLHPDVMVKLSAVHPI